MSLHREVLGLDLRLYVDRKFRFFGPIANQMLRDYAESERDRMLAELERSQAELERAFEQQARREAKELLFVSTVEFGCSRKLPTPLN